MKDLLYALNRVPGVLGSAYIREDAVVSDIGESIGGAEAEPLARLAADACREWMAEYGKKPLEAATFVGTGGRIVMRPVGADMLVAFAENDASAGLLRLKMREIAEKISPRDGEVAGSS